MAAQPFLKWAGGKRWLTRRRQFFIPPYTGRYIEPFLGGGAVFFFHAPDSSLLADTNVSLIEVYQQLRDNWEAVWDRLCLHHRFHNKEHYYKERRLFRVKPTERAAQFLYLNRACWNGLYRVNQQGDFNVPIGTKTSIIFPDDDFQSISQSLSRSVILASDFEAVIDAASVGDFVFADPPYTVAHNNNGFLKYNEKIFSWDDQVRLRDACCRAVGRGATVYVTNAHHDAVIELYRNCGDIERLDRESVIGGSADYRGSVSEIGVLMRSIR